MTVRVDTQAAKERAEARRRLAKWSAPAEASRMGKSGYAPRKGQLAEWVVEMCDDVLALVGLLADAEKALREIRDRVTPDPIVDAAWHRKTARDALAALDAAGGAGE